MQIPKILSHRAVIATAVVATAVALTLAYGVPYGSGNQVTYLVEPLHRAHPELFLQIRHSSRQRRLGAPAGTARPAKAAVGCDEVEVDQSVQVHVFCL